MTCFSLDFIENKLKIDDPVGAISVHGVNGIWGLLAVGVFADGTYCEVRGLITGSGWQLLSQFIASITLIVWCLGMGFLFLSFLKRVIGLRDPISAEQKGLDLYEHGSGCYQ
ncbi:hypothetical protein KsCSTR_43800 [Candidatus Kuenenia stuttgartiensis]|uniref:Ammonium transporter AmtB-like domain-containing protein n=1 Tax=Kuenenia stuttgartiensis TaxID=174633 RepID=A0A6G7GWW6_KUEST|nr:hypothetical protein KsCSTR_43800 [Candidatus Kuenenia stuttgartiensis]